MPNEANKANSVRPIGHVIIKEARLTTMEARSKVHSPSHVPRTNGKASLASTSCRL